MLKLVRVISASAVLLSVSTPAIAQAPAATAAAPQATSKAEADRMNEVVCEKQEVIGSRLSVKRICKTRSQWAAQKLEDRMEVEKVQVQRGMKSE
jgi:hypothetical protein